jgi:hypothetical protein
MRSLEQMNMNSQAQLNVDIHLSVKRTSHFRKNSKTSCAIFLIHFRIYPNVKKKTILFLVHISFSTRHSSLSSSRSSLETTHRKLLLTSEEKRGRKSISILQYVIQVKASAKLTRSRTHRFCFITSVRNIRVCVTT